MSDPFESAKFSIRRAKRHFEDFDALAAEYIAGDAYTVRTDFNALTGLKEVKVKFIRDFPEDLRGYASDAIKNIRDALDQAMSAATFVVEGKRKRHTHFPFGESAENLEECLSGRKASQCRDIPEDLFPAIRHIRPYPHEGDNFRLKLLQKVSGPHKHSVALTLGSAPAQPFAQLEFLGANSNVLASINFPEWDGTKDEVVVATFSGDGSLDLSHFFHIEFDHSELRNIPAGQVLAAWGGRAEWIIAGLEKFAAQIVAERGA